MADPRTQPTDDGRCEASFWREGLSGYRCVMEAGHFPSTPHALNGDVSWTEPLCGYEAEPGRRCIRTDDHSHSSDPTPAPGISEERLAEIEALSAGGFGYYVNDALAELLAEVRRLQQENERYVVALRYCSCPTMGYHGRTTPTDFAVNEATDANVRIALRCCIDTATAALGSSHG